MKVKQRTIATFTALCISGIVGVTLAFYGFSYWGIATQNLCYILITTILFWYFSKWKPTSHFDFTPIKEMFGFSCKLLATNIFNHINNNLFSVILGKFFNEKAVGYYTQGNKWNTMGSSFISSTMSQVAQPVLASINDEANRQERVFRKMLRFTSFIAFPLMFGLALVAHEFILLTVGPTWERCVPLLQILCTGGSFLPLHTLYQNFIISRGRSDLYLRMVSLQIILQIGITLSLASQGVTVMVAAFSLLNVGFTLCWHFALKRIHKLSTADVLKDTLPFALIAIAIMVAVHYATLWTDILWFRLCLRVATAAGLYFLTMRLLHVKTLEECMAFIKQKRL